jgi:hypothetical protein
MIKYIPDGLRKFEMLSLEECWGGLSREVGFLRQEGAV